LVPKEREATHEWVEESPCDGDNLWSAVDEAVGATQGLRGQNLPRSAAAAPGNAAVASATTSSQHHRTYIRTRRNCPRNAAAQDDCEDDSDQQDDVQADVDQDQPLQHESIDEDESISAEKEAAGDGEAFHLDEDPLL
jgi:hypothetical protein